jgi:hypothetical protein
VDRKIALPELVRSLRVQSKSLKQAPQKKHSLFSTKQVFASS